MVATNDLRSEPNCGLTGINRRKGASSVYQTLIGIDVRASGWHDSATQTSGGVQSAKFQLVVSKINSTAADNLSGQRVNSTENVRDY